MNVSIRGCDSYDETLLYNQIKKNIEDLGGLDKYFEVGQTILLKVNLLMKRRPEEATTTHPSFVKALAKHLVDFGLKVIIGDSPGGPYNKSALAGIYKVCGYEDLVNDHISLNQNFGSFTSACDQALLMKQIETIDVINDVDHVVSVSKLKTHGMTLFTGAVKNMYGTIPGLKKAEYHYTLPSIDDFSNMLVDVCLNAKPTLSFMDAVVGMEGAGPSSGEPRQIGLVIASNSPYYLDVVACKIVGIDPQDVPTIKRCYERKIILEENLKVVGESVEDYYISDFKIPSIKGVGLLENRVPKWLNNMVDYVIKPRPEVMSTCIGCGECARCCPAKVIEMVDDRPDIHLSECIRCFCCQELCPAKAINIYRHPIGKIMMKI
ncbi:DUF362 domain-containing protein [Acidaminobacter sp. JC074]|uniref:DUF362 domain-containing protein n=1 Tax=Acidaminobacter sp. JC074 TaxID=2530199 RepID=UPI001F0ED665|nr:DUF362 domain-containing protein [Acidaminobacter sp. JC074]MCH4889157.1 DUF362 domain-containing protein [Acidaminobacter sp. JC074]